MEVYTRFLSNQTQSAASQKQGVGLRGAPSPPLHTGRYASLQLSATVPSEMRASISSAP